MPDTLKDSGLGESTESSGLKGFACRLGELFFRFWKDKRTDFGLDPVIDETMRRRALAMERRALAAKAMKRGYRPGTIEHPEMSPGGRSLKDYESELMFDRRELEGKTVLDLGAGPELRFANDVKAAGIEANVVSLSPDFSDENIALTARKFSEGFMVAGVAQALPFKDETFDEVFALHVAEHLLTNDSRKATICEIARVLRGGGTARIGTIPEETDILRLAREDRELAEYLSSIGVEMELVQHGSIMSLRDDILDPESENKPAIVIKLKKHDYFET